MRTSLRVLAILAAGAAALSGATPPRTVAFAIDGAIRNPNNGHWYKYILNGSFVNWDQCKVNTETLGGYMMTVVSAEEEQWVVPNIMAGKQPAFFGAWDPVTVQNWQWVTGEPFGWTHWAPGDPSPANSNRSRIYSDGSWDALAGGNGGVTMAYVVEWDSDPNPPVPPDAPAAPTDLAASVSTGNPIKLLWRDNSSNEEAFDVERCTATTPYFRVAELGPNSAVYEDVATGPGTEYTYRVRAKNTGGLSDWSNEATVTASAIAPGPTAPSDLRVIAATADSLELAWSDDSVDEIGFEVHRRRPGGDYALVASLPPGSWGFTDTGLPPDMEYEYGVRSLNVYRASGFCEAPAVTLPTLSVTATRADLKDSPRFGKDSLKVQALFDFLPESPDGLLDAIAEGITLRAGPVDRPVVMTLPKNLDTWKVKGTKATWKSEKGTTPKYCIQVDTEKRTVKATAAGLDFAEPPVNPMRVSITVGDDGGSAKGDWETKSPGTFRLR